MGRTVSAVRMAAACGWALGLGPAIAPTAEPPPEVPYRIETVVVSQGFSGKECWFHPRAGVVPGERPRVVLTMQKWWFKASDLFLPLQSLESTDRGATWSAPVEHAATLGRRDEPGGVSVGVCDFTPKWHAATGKLLGIGHTVRYKNDALIVDRPRETVWSVYDPQAATWTPWRVLTMPDEAKFRNSGAGCVQRVDLPNGDILLPTYFKALGTKVYSSTVLKCRFDGDVLSYVAHGSELSVPIDRGLYEPSLTRFADRFHLTLRNDRAAYVAVSDDGQTFAAPKKWTFDDGTELGSRNTQAHWVTHRDGLFLTYTRAGANNDDVIRNRAPLFIAQVDPAGPVVLKARERILVPNTGAQLGNYGVVDVDERESWVTTSEGMHPLPKNHTADGRVYAAKILWQQPNVGYDRR